MPRAVRQARPAHGSECEQNTRSTTPCTTGSSPGTDPTSQSASWNLMMRSRYMAWTRGCGGQSYL
eukprot:12267433-Prorocentrum_lima.AAC.1